MRVPDREAGRIGADPLDSGGERSRSDVSPAYLRGAVLDVTELRRSEWERLEALSLFQQGFEASPIGMAVTGRDGRYVRIERCAVPTARPYARGSAHAHL